MLSVVGQALRSGSAASNASWGFKKKAHSGSVCVEFTIFLRERKAAGVRMALAWCSFLSFPHKCGSLQMIRRKVAVKLLMS